jgi:aminoglycoside phosphotransferase (APT) family kinase protein
VDRARALQAWARAEALAAVRTPATAGKVRVLQRRAGALVLRVELDDEPVVLRLTHADAARGDDERTAAVVGLARAAGVPAPAVLATGPALRPRWRATVEEHVDGVPWQQVCDDLPAAAVAGVHEELAAALLAVQSVRPGGFGELDRSGRPAGVPLLQALRTRVDLRVPAGPALGRAHAVLDREQALFDGVDEPVLTHDDLHSANVLVRRTAGRWHVAALLDWEKAWAGPADADVARLALWDGMTGPGFWSVYRSAVPARAPDARRALVLQLLWCLEHDWPTTRHRADTARLSRLLAGSAPDP